MFVCVCVCEWLECVNEDENVVDEDVVDVDVCVYEDVCVCVL